MRISATSMYALHTEIYLWPGETLDLHKKMVEKTKILGQPLYDRKSLCRHGPL